MPSITVKNIPEDIYKQLKLRAQANHRSINSEIIVCIERVMRNQQVETGESSADIYKVRETKEDYPTVEDGIAKAIVGETDSNLFGESREAFYRLVAEIVEDLLLANAIREGESGKAARREEIDQILGGES
jgi:antitoxin FitA